MGKTLSEDEKNKKSWDSNAITPGTPFMALLAQSLRYWVVQKMNTDPGWKNVSCLYQRAVHNLQSKLFSTSRLKLSSRTLAFRVRESIRLWTTSGDNGLIPDTIRILVMLSMVW